MSHSLALCAYLLDLLLGDPQGLPHPVVWIGALIRRLETLCCRWCRYRTLAGVFLAAGVVGLTLLAGWSLLALTTALHPLFGILAWLWLAYACLATRSLHQESALVIAALEADDLAGARLALARIVSRDTAQLDAEAVLRATCETVAENTSDGSVAPLFYLSIGGPLAALGYKAANTLDSMVGYKNERYAQLGWASARLDDLLNLLPARLTALLMCLGAPLLGLNGWRALCITLRDAGKSSSPNAGYPMAAAAGALGVQFGGAAHYFGVAVTKPTLGDPRHPVTINDYRRLIRLLYLTSALSFLLMQGVIIVLSGGWH